MPGRVVYQNIVDYLEVEAEAKEVPFDRTKWTVRVEKVPFWKLKDLS